MIKKISVLLICLLSFVGFVKADKNKAEADGYSLLCQYVIEKSGKTIYVEIYQSNDKDKPYGVYLWQNKYDWDDWHRGTVSKINNDGILSNSKSFKDPAKYGCPKTAYAELKDNNEVCFDYNEEQSDKVTVACRVTENTGTNFSKGLTSTRRTVNNSTVKYNGEENINVGDFSNSDGCEGFLGSVSKTGTPAFYLHYIISVLRYVAIILLLVFTVMDFGKAVVSQDKDALKKEAIRAAKRLVYTILIYFIPAVLDFLLKLIGAYSTCGI